MSIESIIRNITRDCIREQTELSTALEDVSKLKSDITDAVEKSEAINDPVRKLDAQRQIERKKIQLYRMESDLKKLQIQNSKDSINLLDARIEAQKAQ
jgi:hypothetical protein